MRNILWGAFPLTCTEVTVRLENGVYAFDHLDETDNLQTEVLIRSRTDAVFYRRDQTSVQNLTP